MQNPRTRKMAALLLAALGALQLQLQPAAFETFANYTAVCGPCACGGPYEPSIRAAVNASTPDSVFLGLHDSSSSCAAACESLPACAAYTYFTAEGDGWQRGCYGIVNGSYNGWWSPYSMGQGCSGAVSGIRQRPCASDGDCALNGICEKSACVCDPGWRGYDCSRLDLRPTPRDVGYCAPSPEPTTEQAANSSWGGSIVAAGDGTGYIMFAAQLAQQCGIAAWEPTSLVVRARSESSVLGPYRFDDVIIPNFAHEPVAARAGGTGSRGTGPVLLYHIGRGNSSRSFGNCSLCLGGRSPDPIGDCTDVPGFNPPIRISYADSWSAPASSWKEVPGDLWPGDENPSPWVYANGAHLAADLHQHSRFKKHDTVDFYQDRLGPASVGNAVHRSSDSSC
jgi:hypothetical protein